MLETSVPAKCLDWSFLVGNMQFRTGDYANNQASLNAFQARLDSDGKSRAVIASCATTGSERKCAASGKDRALARLRNHLTARSRSARDSANCMFEH